MKRTRKTRKTFTDTQKRGLVNEVTRLVSEGIKLTAARIEIAFRHKTTPISLARWSKDITNTIVGKSNGKMLLVKSLQPIITNTRTSTIHVTSVNLHVPGKGNITLDHELLNHISKLASYSS